MLIKRLLHRWVLMEEAGGTSSGGGAAAATGGSAGGSGAAASGTAEGTGASTSGTGAAAAAGDAGAGNGAAATGASTGETTGTASTTSTSLEAPASIAGEAGKETQTDGTQQATTGEADKPVEYTDFTLPEGVSVDADTMAAFKEAAAGSNLSQEQAQKFVDLHQAAIDKASKAPYELWRDTQKKWQDEVKADPEFGGAKLEKETIPAIARAIKAFSPSADAEKALRQAMSFTGAGNNPEMIRFLARVGKSIGEGTHVGGKPAGGDGGRSAAELMYPSHAASKGQS